ncbi:phosphoribosylformylglycinamidine cyclo-ligase [Anoxybacter fermentans]|uniref:Phosphoribosylformylglycinamidine cyclo-ligase n=1 Tax=Anoxybacter fermentans TaxID=1323375 RepID=A0A3S9T109_9FIRM|nr:phosphoribosylformylglycinamidine cyclo-ligase [Anoxybacter fermentans]AZR74231.1 phosphoribosylformylglycinamidine cyclo-ligase [Anoxybacter fermentans]
MGSKFSYRDAGVDIDAGNQAVERIKGLVARTHNPAVLAGLGGFGGLFKLDIEKMKEPVLVSGTDGVGSKIKIAMALDRHDTVGIDLVAMCVNDILAQGARPLFFLDYLAVNKVIPEQIEALVSGIAEGCLKAECALIGGETAEMPDLYQPGEYDMAGFAVGIVERKKMITGENVRAGDLLLGLKSSGIHSNGYSLVRKIFSKERGYELDMVLPELGLPLGEVLLTPTRIYVKPVLALLDRFTIGGIAHITGGGLLENIPRSLPKGLKAVVDEGSWPRPAIFEIIERSGVEKMEMYRTFNQGIGMVLIVKPEELKEIQELLSEMGEESYVIGEVTQRKAGEAACQIRSV